MRRIAVLSACVLAGGLVAPTAALAGEGGGDQWIAVEGEFAAVLPNGDTITEDEPAEGDANFVPPVGTRFFIGETLYETEDGTTRGDEIGRSHIQCTIQIVPDEVLCDVAFVLEDGSQLHGSAFISFSAQNPDEPLSADIAVTGGTGQYAGATGVVSLLDISDHDDPAAEAVTLYEPDLS